MAMSLAVSCVYASRRGFSIDAAILNRFLVSFLPHPASLGVPPAGVFSRPHAGVECDDSEEAIATKSRIFRARQSSGLACLRPPPVSPKQQQRAAHSCGNARAKREGQRLFHKIANAGALRLYEIPTMLGGLPSGKYMPNRGSVRRHAPRPYCFAYELRQPASHFFLKEHSNVGLDPARPWSRLFCAGRWLHDRLRPALGGSS